MNFLRAVLFEDEFEPIPSEEVEKRELTTSKLKESDKNESDEKGSEGKESEAKGGGEGGGDEAKPLTRATSVEKNSATESEITEELPSAEEGTGSVQSRVVPKPQEMKDSETGGAHGKDEDGQDGDEEGEEEEEGEEGEDEGEEEEEEQEEQQFFPSLGGGWSFGGLVKAIASKSEEVFREYQAELQEFGRELRKETEDLVETTAHTVKDLPTSLETGAHVAQSSLEGVGQTIEEIGSSIWKGTADIINQVKEAIAAVDEEALRNAQGGSRAVAGYTAAIQKGKYSRYEAQVSAMQRDSSTYCDEPEDAEEFAKWSTTFNLDDKKEDIDTLLKENAFMQELQSRIVPLIVERETFWTRYFYRLHKLQQAEDARADLVKRAATAEEEELTWDVDDEEEGTPKKAAPSEGEDAASEEGKAKDTQVTKAASKEADAGSGVSEDGARSSSSSSEWQVVAKEEEREEKAGPEEPKGEKAREPALPALKEEKAEESKPPEEPKVASPTAAAPKPREPKVASPSAGGSPSPAASAGERPAAKSGEKGAKGGSAGDEEVDEDWGEWE